MQTTPDPSSYRFSGNGGIQQMAREVKMVEEAVAAIERIRPGIPPSYLRHIDLGLAAALDAAQKRHYTLLRAQAEFQQSK